MDWQPKVTGIHKDTFHSVIVLKLGMASGAFYIAKFGFDKTETEWTLDVTLWLGSGSHHWYQINPM